MSKLISSTPMWKEGGGYYTGTPEELILNPLLPNIAGLRERRILEVFRHYGNLQPESQILEIGCGKSKWLPCLAQQFNCKITGIDIEPYAAELARANLVGAKVKGKILCRDAFDINLNRDLHGKFDLIYSMGVLEHFDDVVERIKILSAYLKPGGRMVTTVPNLQGVNWLLQRYASLERLHMHIIYDTKKLTRIHESADLKTIAVGYAGFYDGYVSGGDQKVSPLRQKIHHQLSWVSNMTAEVWLRLWQGRLTPEWKWFAPHVFWVGGKYGSQ